MTIALKDGPWGLSQLLSVLRRNGVQRFATVGITVEFEKAQPAELADQEEQSRSLCACGHDLNTEHNQFGCLLGCDSEKCLSEAKS